MYKHPKVIIAVFLIICINGVSAWSFDPETVDVTTLKQMQYMPDEILVAFHPGITLAEKERIHALTGALDIRNGYGDTYQIITVPDGKIMDMINDYLQRPGVVYAEPNYFRFAHAKPNDPLYGYQWNMDQIRAPAAWDQSTGAGVIVAIIDTGIHVEGADSFGGRVIGGYNFVKDNENYADNNGHGTHVAGTIAQETNNGIGVAGVAYDAQLLGIKVLNRMGVGTDSDISDGIRWAADYGARVINMSLGGSAAGLTLQNAVNYASAGGVVICAAAGNSGTDTLDYPAKYEACIAVGAIRYDKKKSGYSSYGNGLDMVAPGGDTGVDQNGDGNGDGILQESFFNLFHRLIWGYYFFQGTSMSTPHVSGVAALVLSKHPYYSPDDVRNVLQSTAVDLGSPGYDTTYGWGLVDAAAAVSR
ncbi:MAG: S8 family peptidase [Desulfatirhabdiaceae bacterium]